MAKYSKKLTQEIVKLIEEDNYTITQICRITGISRKLFYLWRESKPEFAEAVEAAEAHRQEKLQLAARQSMRKKLEGYRQIETKTTYRLNKDGELEVKEYIVKEKYCVPETSAIVHTLSEEKEERKEKAKKVSLKDTEKEKQESTQAPWTIIVPDEQVKHDLELLRKFKGNPPPDGYDYETGEITTQPKTG